MELLNGLLAHYQQLFKDKQLEIGSIVEVVKKQTGLIITNKEVELKEGILLVKTKPKYKLEIILKKKAILEQLNNQGIKVFNLK